MTSTDEGGPTGSARDRRSFLRASGGYATGIAVAIGIPGAAGVSSASAADGGKPGQAIEHPSTAAPSEPVMAYVHDAERGEVTIMAGTEQMTYRDPVLVRRLLAAAKRKRV
jgi:hypothetical protein